MQRRRSWRRSQHSGRPPLRAGSSQRRGRVSRSPRLGQSGWRRPLRIPGRLLHLPDLRADTQRGPGHQGLSSVVPTTILFRLTGGLGSEAQGRRPRRHPQSGRISGGAPHLGFGRAPQSRPPS
ncbi:hypothetical protein NDU88_001421 [Pleurodeles waltl]|uniref:Uncharacterized protein n=1 Tax=Pleurodeles waltl TaxID=8319 RepID=A0AAV7VAC4_PLEWA|nr:hypothetical protein NDU88_001421 [Pleurodeles waltl]